MCRASGRPAPNEGDNDGDDWLEQQQRRPDDQPSTIISTSSSGGSEAPPDGDGPDDADSSLAGARQRLLRLAQIAERRLEGFDIRTDVHRSPNVAARWRLEGRRGGGMVGGGVGLSLTAAAIAAERTGRRPRQEVRLHHVFMCNALLGDGGPSSAVATVCLHCCPLNTHTQPLAQHAQAPSEPPAILIDIPARPAAAAPAPPAPGAPPITPPPPPVDDARWRRKLRANRGFGDYMRELRAVEATPGERTSQLVYQVGGLFWFDLLCRSRLLTRLPQTIITIVLITAPSTLVLNHRSA